MVTKCSILTVDGVYVFFEGHAVPPAGLRIFDASQWPSNGSRLGDTPWRSPCDSIHKYQDIAVKLDIFGQFLENESIAENYHRGTELTA